MPLQYDQTFPSMTEDYDGLENYHGLQVELREHPIQLIYGLTGLQTNAIPLFQK